MSLLLLLFFLLLNAGISWWNSYAIGKSWRYMQDGPTIQKLSLYSGVVMTYVGWTWCILVLVALGINVYTQLTNTALIPMEYIELVFDIAIWILLVLAVASGIVIMIQSWVRAIKSGSAIDIGIAAWNTYAQVSNILSLAKHTPKASSAWKKLKDVKDPRAILAIIIGLSVFILGGYVTYALIKKYMVSEEEYLKDIGQYKGYLKKDLV